MGPGGTRAAPRGGAWLLAVLALSVAALGALAVLDAPTARAETTAGNVIHLPIRWCTLSGTDAERRPNTDLALLMKQRRATDRIWMRGATRIEDDPEADLVGQAGISFRSPITWGFSVRRNFPVVRDPVRAGREGDVIDPFIDQREMDRIVNDCRDAWKRMNLKAKAPSVGPIVVNIRRFVTKDGTVTKTLGYGGHSVVHVRREGWTTGTVCDRDPIVASSGGRLLITETDDPWDDAKILAHELGHVLKLGHGNGKDDDGDRLVDYYCDTDEDKLADRQTVMTPWVPLATSRVTKAERALARRVARVHVGASLDPPGTLVPGDVIGDEAVDGLGEVDPASIDIAYLGVATNVRERVLLVTLWLGGRLQGGDDNDYTVFLDLDGDPETGGVPTDAGYESALEGVDHILEVAVAVDDAGQRTVTPAVLRWGTDGFEVVDDADGTLIAADVQSTLGEEPPGYRAQDGVKPEGARAPVNDVITLYVDGFIADPGPVPFRMRVQALARSVATGAGDTLPGDAVDLFFRDPEYPVCAVEPDRARPGEPVTVRAEHLSPAGAMAEILLGTDPIGEAAVDAQGRVEADVVVPDGAFPGLRLVTIGLPDSALTADCSLIVEPAGGDSGISGTTPSGRGTGGEAGGPTLVARPAIAVRVTADTRSVSAAGDVVGLRYQVSNTGNVDLAGPVTVKATKTNGPPDLLAGPARPVLAPAAPDPAATTVKVSCPRLGSVGDGDRWLDPGERLVCTTSYEVTQGDMDAGSVTITAWGTATFDGRQVESVRKSVTVTASTGPALTLVKSAGTSAFGAVGDPIDYVYILTNTGNVTLVAPFSVDDDWFAAHGAPDAVTCPGGSIGPGEAVTCTARHTVTQADLDAGSITNTAVGHSTSDGAPIDSNSDTVTVTSRQQPALSIVKTADRRSFDRAGTVIQYTFSVTNSGNVTLAGPVTVTDDLTADEDCPRLAALAPGENVTCTASHTTTQADLDAGHVTNRAVAHASFGGRVVDSNRAEVTVGGAQGPALALVKSANVASVDRVGDVIRYTFALTNTGNVSLSGPAVRDPLTSDESCQEPPAVGDGDGTLDPGETLGCTASYTVTQADLDAGRIVNTATGSASSSGRAVDSPAASATVTANQAPALRLVKTADRATYAAVGEVIRYTYQVANAGNVTLAGPVSVSDDRATDEQCPDVGNLAPGASVTCTASHTVTQADLDAGSITNTATAQATWAGRPVTESRSLTIPATLRPQLTLAKSADVASYDHAGQVITYTFTLRNTGNVTLSPPITVTDDLTTDEACASLATVGDRDDRFDPGETITCSATYRVTQGDLDAGRTLTNTATGHAAWGAATVDSAARTVTVAPQLQPQLTLSKRVASVSYPCGEGDTCYDEVSPFSYRYWNQTIAYAYTLTNSGNVTLSAPYSVTDDHVSPVTCPAPVALAPGASIACTGSYDVTMADVDAGSVTNTATGRATYGAETIISSGASATVDAQQEPELGLAKTAVETHFDAAGDVIHYSFEVWNLGNVRLTGPITVDDDLTLDETCPDVDTVPFLAQGDSITCSASYEVTSDDVAEGIVTNMAIAHAFFAGASVVSEPDLAWVGVPGTDPRLSLTKTSSMTSYPNVEGVVIPFTLTVENTGNVRLLGPVTVFDEDVDDLACPGLASVGNGDGYLDPGPGERFDCTASITTTAENLGRCDPVSSTWMAGTVYNFAAVSVPRLPGATAYAEITLHDAGTCPTGLADAGGGRPAATPDPSVSACDGPLIVTDDTAGRLPMGRGGARGRMIVGEQPIGPVPCQGPATTTVEQGPATTRETRPTGTPVPDAPGWGPRTRPEAAPSPTPPPHPAATPKPTRISPDTPRRHAPKRTPGPDPTPRPEQGPKPQQGPKPVQGPKPQPGPTPTPGELPVPLGAPERPASVDGDAEHVSEAPPAGGSAPSVSAGPPTGTPVVPPERAPAPEMPPPAPEMPPPAPEMPPPAPEMPPSAPEAAARPEGAVALLAPLWWIMPVQLAWFA